MKDETHTAQLTWHLPFRTGGLAVISNDSHKFHVRLEFLLIFFDVKSFQIALDIQSQDILISQYSIIFSLSAVRTEIQVQKLKICFYTSRITLTGH